MSPPRHPFLQPGATEHASGGYQPGDASIADPTDPVNPLESRSVRFNPITVDSIEVVPMGSRNEEAHPQAEVVTSHSGVLMQQVEAPSDSSLQTERMDVTLKEFLQEVPEIQASQMEVQSHNVDLTTDTQLAGTEQEPQNGYQYLADSEPQDYQLNKKRVFTLQANNVPARSYSPGFAPDQNCAALNTQAQHRTVFKIVKSEQAGVFQV